MTEHNSLWLNPWIVTVGGGLLLSLLLAISKTLREMAGTSGQRIVMFFKLRRTASSWTWFLGPFGIWLSDPPDINASRDRKQNQSPIGVSDQASSDVIEGIKWRWEWNNETPTQLKAFCAKCDYQLNFRASNPDEPGWWTHMNCPSCRVIWKEYSEHWQTSAEEFEIHVKKCIEANLRKHRGVYIPIQG